MSFLTANLRLTGVALGAVLVVLPLANGACGNTACLVYSQAQYAASNGCPSATSALRSFSSPECPGAVTKVDGAATFDGEYCCYPVTQQAQNGDQTCIIGDGGGGFGGNGGGGFAGSGAGGTACAPDGDPCGSEDDCCQSLICNAENECAPFGAGGSGGGCTSCSVELTDLGATASDLCAAAATFWDSLITCSCNGGTCSEACTPTFCSGVAPDTGCSTCLDDTTSGCAAELSACQSN